MVPLSFAPYINKIVWFFLQIPENQDNEGNELLESTTSLTGV